MTIEELELALLDESEFYIAFIARSHMPGLLNLAKAAKKAVNNPVWAVVCDEDILLEEALKELER